MLNRPNHRHYRAGILLVLYAFLATPAPFWHSCFKEHLQYRSHNDALVLSKVPGKLCKVCDHHYDPYLDEPFFETPACIGCFNVERKVKIDNHLIDCNFSRLPNKSPPLAVS